MARQTQGRISATMPGGINPQRNRACLNALLVVCHGWRNRNAPPAPVSANGGLWLAPLKRWARPIRRAA